MASEEAVNVTAPADSEHGRCVREDRWSRQSRVSVSTHDRPGSQVLPEGAVASKGTFKTSLVATRSMTEESAMANERLRRAIQRAGLRLEDVADCVEIDVKTVERWITKGRVPHARNRARTAQLLRVDEIELWPEIADERRRGGDGEVVRLYPH